MRQAHASPEDVSSPVKHYLMEYTAMLQRKNALQSELERLQEATVRVTSRLSDIPKSGPSAPDSGENAMLRTLDARDRLLRYLEDIGEALCARLALIEQVADERQKTLLTLRYINGYAWEKIGYAMHYERTQVFAIHAQALQAAQTAMDAARQLMPRP